MRAVLLTLGGFAVGAAVVALWTQAGTDPGRASVLQADAPEAGETKAPAPKDVSPALSVGTDSEAARRAAKKRAASRGPRPMDPERLRKVVKEIQGAYAEKDQQQQRRIRELLTKVERLEATAPEPAILDNLRDASVEELGALMREVRDLVTKRLLTPPAHIASRHADFLAGEGTGAARLLVRGAYDKLIEQRGGGAYWSFKTKSNSYDDEPDLSLESGDYRTGFYGGSHGFLMDLEDLPIEDVEADARIPPATLRGVALDQWSWMWKAAEAESARRPDRRRIPGTSPDLGGSIKAVSGHTYLLRAILHGEHDILVVFRAVETDKHGQTIVYRILKEFEMPRR